MDNMWNSLADNPELCKNKYDSSNRIPIIEDYGGSIWYLDFDVAEKGIAGQVICIFRDMPETIYNVAQSLDAYLLLILNELAEGRAKLNSEYGVLYNANAW